MQDLTPPKNVGALMLDGTIQEQRGDIPKARESYEKVLAENPRFAPPSVPRIVRHRPPLELL